MSILETANLIDFGNEDVIGEPLEKTAKEYNPSNTMISKMCTPSLVPQGTESYFRSLNATTPEQRRESLDNNPFDSVQKLANRPDDPFEIVEKQANQKARPVQASTEVKLGKLLSMSDDNLIDEDNETNDYEKYATCPVNYSDSSKNAGNYDCSTAVSSIYNTANCCHVLDSESPPLTLSQKWTPDSGNSTDSGSASSIEVGTSGKSKKAIENRKRLLKLSISNSTFNSPVSRPLQTKEGFAENSGNLSMIFAEAAQLGEHFIAADSPLKLVDDDIMSEEPNWIDSEKDFDDDLEMLKIPMLQQLPSPSIEEQSAFTSNIDTKKNSATNKESESLIDLVAIRAKLKTKRELSNNNQDISMLIGSLKSLIADINVGDDNKKQQAATLLDTLSSALGSGGGNNPYEQPKEKQEVVANMSSIHPQPIVRQGTFDMELQEKGLLEKSNHAITNQPSQPTQYAISENNSVQSTQKCEEIPDAMIRSSATYDGETAEDKQDLILPEILPSSPQPLHQSFDINDIVEQLGKLLEQHHLNNMHSIEPGIDGATQTAAINPTFIVVMNTSQAPSTTAQQRNSFVANYLENSTNESSDSHSSVLMRRRSQSLSLHDKVKVVQLPLMPIKVIAPDPVACDSDVDVSPASTPPLDAEASEFKTPSRMISRRYSFSSATPYTPVHSNFGSAAAQRRASGISETTSQIQMRRASVLSTHHERQSNTSVSSTATTSAASVRPMPALNLNSLKPDITNKKKLKSSAPSDSLFKSSVPLKATMPLKKVAPMIKTSPPTPEIVAGKKKNATSSSNNTSMQLLTKSGKLAYTSTPMPPSRSASSLDLAAGYPNACSTPTVRTSPMKRSAMNASRRYSYLAATPCAKQTAFSSTSAAAAAGLRRRTLSELKAKSPVKSRMSNIGGITSNMTTASTGKTSGPTRTRAPLNVPKTANKLTPTSMGRTNSRSSARTSIVSTTATHRNKENKHP